MRFASATGRLVVIFNGSAIAVRAHQQHGHFTYVHGSDGRCSPGPNDTFSPWLSMRIGLRAEWFANDIRHAGERSPVSIHGRLTSVRRLHSISICSMASRIGDNIATDTFTQMLINRQELILRSGRFGSSVSQHRADVRYAARQRT